MPSGGEGARGLKAGAGHAPSPRPRDHGTTGIAAQPSHVPSGAQTAKQTASRSSSGNGAASLPPSPPPVTPCANTPVNQAGVSASAAAQARSAPGLRARRSRRNGPMVSLAGACPVSSARRSSTGKAGAPKRCA